MSESLGFWIRFERMRQRLGQGALAKQVAIHRNTLRHIEQGRCNPGVATIQRISQVLGVSIDDLVKGQPWQRPLP